MRNMLKVGIGVTAMILLASCRPSSDPTGNVGQGRADGLAEQILAADNTFSPTELRLEAGREVTIEVTNRGDAPHEFAIERFDLTTGTIQPGETTHATFVVPRGTTAFACTYHGGMRGTIVGERESR